MKIGIAFVAGLLVAGLFAYLVTPSRAPEPAPQAVVTPVQPAFTEPTPAAVAEPAPAPGASEPKPAEPKSAPVAVPARPRRQEPPPRSVAKANPTPTAPARPAEPSPTPAEAPKAVETARVEPDRPAPEPENPLRHTSERLAKPIEQPNFVTIEAGTLVVVRLSESLSSDSHKSGDKFNGVLDKPLVVDGFVVAERGGRVEGRVVQANPAGRVKGTSFLRIELTRLQTADGQWVDLNTEVFEREGEKSVKQDAAKVGAAAGIAAAIGAIAGGGKGAAIGAVIGGAAGTGGVLATRGKPATLPVETRVSFKIKNPVSITEKI
ncbi:MAG: hypothetical protein SFV54_27875 [Bryobacteraceae bacterium]|nr:hypothetical protein [Bryobacteraceae bacterium]